MRAVVCLIFAVIFGVTVAGQDKTQSMPGMKMPPASPSPSPSPSPETMNMKMAMPSPSPQASRRQEMNMPMPTASPSPGSSGEMESMSSHDIGPMLVMKGNDMAVRIGPTDNLLYCGQMGSGTSWSPHNSPLRMWDKISGGWLLMFHFNAFVGVNSQGGPRGVIKFESANWFMPMAFHKLGNGTL